MSIRAAIETGRLLFRLWMWLRIGRPASFRTRRMFIRLVETSGDGRKLIVIFGSLWTRVVDDCRRRRMAVWRIKEV